MPLEQAERKRKISLTNAVLSDNITDIGKSNEKEEYVLRAKREDGSPAERRSGMADTEGSF